MGRAWCLKAVGRMTVSQMMVSWSWKSPCGEAIRNRAQVCRCGNNFRIDRSRRSTDRQMDKLAGWMAAISAQAWAWVPQPQTMLTGAIRHASSAGSRLASVSTGEIFRNASGTEAKQLWVDIAQVLLDKVAGQALVRCVQHRRGPLSNCRSTLIPQSC